MQISKIFWIVHPAFTLDSYKGQPKHTSKEIDKGLDHLKNLAKRVSKDPNAVIAIVRTPFLKAEGNQNIAMRKVLQEKEKKLIKELHDLLGQRLIVSGQKGINSTKEVAKQLHEQLKKKNFKFTNKTRNISAGSFLELCVREYPNELINHYSLKHNQKHKKVRTIKSASFRR